MKAVYDLLKELKQLGARVYVEDGQLGLDIKRDLMTAEIANRIKLHRDDLITFIQKGDQGEELAEIEPVKLQRSYAISHAQKRLWILSQFEEGAQAYHLPGQLHLNQDIDVDCFKKAIDATIERHEILRTVFKKDDENEGNGLMSSGADEDHGGVRQWVLSTTELGFEIDYRDFRGQENQEELVTNYIADDTGKPFNLEKGPLLRAALLQTADDEYVFYYNMHHIISDGWSMEVMSKDIMTFYAAYKANPAGEVTEETAGLVPLNIQYKDFSAWQLAQLKQDNFEQHKSFWMENLSGKLPMMDLPGIKKRPLVQTYKGYELTTLIDQETTDKLRDYVGENGGSLFMGLLAAWNVLIYRYTDQTDIITGTPIAGREHADLENQIGFYINALAVRNNLEFSDDFATFYERLKANVLACYTHQSYPFDLLLENLNRPRDRSRNPVFDVSMTYHNASGGFDVDVPHESLVGRIAETGEAKVKHDMELHFREEGSFMSFTLIYNTAVYDQDLITQVMQHYKKLLHALLDKPQENLAQVDFLFNAEKIELLEEFNPKGLHYSANETILDLFRDHVNESPDSIAVVFEGKMLSFKELDERSNQLAHYLHQNHSIKPNDLIGVQLEVSEWMIIAILGILKAGGAYVPIDANYPAARKVHIVSDSGISLLITESAFIYDLDYFEGTIFAIDLEFDPEEANKGALAVNIQPNHLAYVIYTSGSTGKPKGVMIEHGNIMYSISARNDLYRDPQVFILLSSVSFDSSVAGIFETLTSGGRLILNPTVDAKNLDKIAKIILDQEVTRVIAVPSFYKVLLQKLGGQPNNLRRVTVAGEECPKQLVDEHLNNPNLADCVLYNEYGPTECTIWATYVKYAKNESFKATIGRPISDTRIYILNQALQIQPKGVIGEIFIGGPGVAKGYLNLEEATQDKFLNDPFVPGARMYKSGDLARWYPNGDLEFIGRKDDQVKIRGYRIELGEIEQSLRSIQAVNDAVVVTKINKHEEKEIVAYIIAHNPQNAGDLSTALRQYLPEHMVPTQFVQLAEFPLTSNGKIDKKALPDPNGIGLSTGVEYQAPTNELEENLVKVWEEILQKEPIGVKDNFFELGGHSLKAIMLINKIENDLDVKLKIEEIMTNPTIEVIANNIKARQWVDGSKEINNNERETIEL